MPTCSSAVESTPAMAMLSFTVRIATRSCACCNAAPPVYMCVDVCVYVCVCMCVGVCVCVCVHVRESVSANTYECDVSVKHSFSGEI